MGSVALAHLAPALTAEKIASEDAKTESNKTLNILDPNQIARLSEPLLNRPDAKQVRLSLSDAIQRALKHNLDLRISSYDPAVRLNDLVRAEAAFDAVLFGSALFDNTDRANLQSGFFTETITTPQGTTTVRKPSDPFVQTEDYNYEIGLRKRLPTGASIEFGQQLRRFRVEDDADTLFYDPFYEYTYNLQLNQPLLRDFGIDLNRASINAARNNYRASQHQFQLAVINLVAQTEILYWQLVQGRQQVLIFRNLLYRANLDRQRQSARQEYDAQSTIISRSAATVATFKANLIRAESLVLQFQDQLLDLFNDPQLDVKDKWEILVETPPSTQTYVLDRAAAIAAATELRPELQIQKLQLDTADILVGVTENQVLPRLDMLIQQEASGAGTTSGGAWDEQNRFNTIDYQGGVSFEIPLGGNRAAQSDLFSARHQRMQETLRLLDLTKQVEADVSISINNMENAYKTMLARQEAARHQENTLLSYQAQEDADAVITPAFLSQKIDTLERVASNQATLAAAIQEYNIAITNVHLAQGKLLHYNNIKLAELPLE
jgi:outer membrane protein TolC